MIHRPPLKYFGGKWRLAPWIISHFPPHQAYVEPFGGSAAVLLRKNPSPFEVYNDIDGEVVNFFKMLREKTEELIREIELTPWSREEQRLSFEECNDPIERARRFYVRSWQTHGGPRTQWSSGWRYHYRINASSKPPNSVRHWNDMSNLWKTVERIKNVQIECDDAFSVIGRFDGDETLFYVDPPYLPETRSKKWRDKAYKYEMTTEEHTRLAEALRSVKGMVVLSGYPSDKYKDMFPEWEVRQKTSLADKAIITQECLWLSPSVSRGIQQPSLFGTKG